MHYVVFLTKNPPNNRYCFAFMWKNVDNPQQKYVMTEFYNCLKGKKYKIIDHGHDSKRSQIQVNPETENMTDSGGE